MRRSFVILLLLICIPAASFTGNDAYRNFEKGLEESSGRINGTSFHPVIYSLDEKTAAEYFSRYLSTHQLNRELAINLVYPVFHWRNNHLNLQRGIAAAFIHQLETFYALPETKRDEILKDRKNFTHYFYIHLSLHYIPEFSKELPVDEQNQIAGKLKSITLMNMSYLAAKPGQSLDVWKNRQALRIQQILTLVSFADKTGNLSLLDGVMGSTPRKEMIWRKWSAMCIDNGYFSDATMTKIEAFMRTLPKRFIWPRVVLCYDCFIPDRDTPVSIHRFRCRANFFNTFQRQVGRKGPTQFPDDYAAVSTDMYMSVYIHELMHGVDSRFVEKNEKLRDHKKRLLQSAGNNRENYLRRMFENGFFTRKPQEFIASISNMYFTSTMDTFVYSLQKAEKGNYNQISQFLFFASLFVEDGKINFYRITEEPDIKPEIYSVTVAEGLITSIDTGTTRYRFTWGDTLVREVKTETGK